MNSVSIVIPAYNEEKNIKAVLARTNALLCNDENLKMKSCEVIVVNDGSSDRTPLVARENGVKVINLKKNCGKGFALRVGFHRAKGDIIVMMDADGSHLPQEVPFLIKKIEEGYDVVVASRRLGHSEDMDPIRNVGNHVITGFFNLLFDSNFTDCLNGLKAFKASTLKNIELSYSGFDIEVEILAKTIKNGNRIAEVVSLEKRRLHGESNLKTFRDGLRYILAMLKLRFFAMR